MTGEEPPALRVTFERRADGDTVMRCTRRDGSSVWQRQKGARATFFVYHDLTHLGVERVLDTADGFFGLSARGWEIADTEGAGTRGPVPAGAIAIENLVGLFDRERASGVLWNADEFNEAARLYAEQHGREAPPPLDDATIAAIRADVASLHEGWRAIPPGGVLELDFRVRAGAAS